MTSKRDTRETQLPLSKWIAQLSRRLSISNKISYGYALTLGIVVVGTTAGFTIGDSFERTAKEQEEHAHQEIRLLHRLQTGIIQARTHQQQFIPLMDEPEKFQEEYSHFLHHAAEITKVFLEVKSFEERTPFKDDPNTEDIEQFLHTYEDVPEVYFQQINQLLKQIDPLNIKSGEIDAAQKLLLKFTNSSVALKFDGFSDDLTELIQSAYQQDGKAQTALIAAETIRVQIIATSIFLSIVFAALCAVFTSRAIAHPILAATDVAERVTKEANFDLQAPVTTKDEVGVLATSLNQLIQQVKHLLEEQKAATQTQLLQSEKMSSLGRMLAGVAHEINNPVNFIYGNIIHASEYIDELISLLETYQKEVSNPSPNIQQQADEIDIEFLKEDLPKLLQSMKFGAERTRAIVLSLKDFSRLDQTKATFVDLHACIDSTLLILNHRLNKEIAVQKNYGDIPPIEGYTSLLYQVFMNLLSNAIDALEEVKGLQEIVISTELIDKDWVKVKISDNGSGIAPENQGKIFDTFFTTKPRSVGTGLGLSISYQIVVEKHGGKLNCLSLSGKGTEFAIALPVKHEPNKAPA
ncbi:MULTISPECIES: ATP-binding protein [Cyanophyceae]|uniref:ATP-binding protein n=1 Tax=Cyanophyceae TaxID=3028117 RepID=UPI0018F0301E